MSALPVPATAKGEATRAHILNTAAGLFAARGYTATTFTELIAASGHAKGSVYFYFPAKEQLAYAVLEAKQRQVREALTNRIAARERGLDRFRALGPAMLALLREDPTSWSTGRLARDLAQVPALSARVAVLNDAWVGLLAGIIAQAQTEGDFVPTVDARRVAETLVAAFDGIKLYSDSFGDGDPDAFAERVGLLIQFAEQALLAD